ncbi:hypothetical protein OSTOST_04622, partial [Ostertagia ostertagi]
IVQYKGEYHANHPTILAFWEAFFELTSSASYILGNLYFMYFSFLSSMQLFLAIHRLVFVFPRIQQFLQFLMGSTRLPVGGMSSMKMYVQPTAPEVLPVAHTCFNLLDLPNIADSKELLRRLRISIQHTQGFTLV